MHTHRVEILNRTDDGNVVVRVSQEFQLELLPAEYRFFHEYFVDGRCRQATVQRFVQEFLAVDEAATCSAEGEGRANDQRKSDLLGELLAFQE